MNLVGIGTLNLDLGLTNNGFLMILLKYFRVQLNSQSSTPSSPAATKTFPILKQKSNSNN